MPPPTANFKQNRHIPDALKEQIKAEAARRIVEITDHFLLADYPARKHTSKGVEYASKKGKTRTWVISTTGRYAGWAKDYRGENHDAPSLVRHFQGGDYLDALHWLADFLSIPLPDNEHDAQERALRWAEDKAQRDAQRAEEEARQERIEAEAHKAARIAAVDIFTKLPRADKSHPYAARKGISILSDVRIAGTEHRAKLWNSHRNAWNKRGLVARAGALVIPLQNASGEIENIQTIQSDGIKLFLSGGKKKGLFHVIPGVEPGYLVEGFATGCTVAEATGRAVFVALDAGNLPAAAKVLTGRVDAVAADHDKSGTGEKKAKETGLRYLMPPTIGHDWNDHAATHGLESVAALLAALTQPEPSKPLHTLKEGREKIASAYREFVEKVISDSQEYPGGRSYRRLEIRHSTKDETAALAALKHIKPGYAAHLHATVGAGKTHPLPSVARDIVTNERKVMINRIAEAEAAEETQRPIAEAEREAIQSSYATEGIGSENFLKAAREAGNKAFNDAMRFVREQSRRAKKPRPVVILEQTIEKADELARDFAKAYQGENNAPSIMVLRGMSQTDPDAPDTTMCQRMPEVQTFLKHGLNRLPGLSVKSYFCEPKGTDGCKSKCPLFETCGYQKQRAAMKANPPEIVLATHEKLISGGLEPCAIICDENPHSVADPDEKDANYKIGITALSLTKFKHPKQISGLLAQEVEHARILLETIAAENGDGPLSRAVLERLGVSADGMREHINNANYWACGNGKTGDKAKPGALPFVDPAAVMAGDPDALKALRDWKNHGVAIRLYREIARFMDDEKRPARSGRLRILEQADGLFWQVSAVRSLSDQMDAPTLILSASLYPEAVRHLWPHLETLERIDVAEPNTINIRIPVEMGKGHFFDFAGYGRTPTAKPKSFQGLSAFLSFLHHKVNGKALVGVQKALIEADLLSLPDGYDLRNYGGVSGLNNWSNVSMIVCAGRPLPTPASVEAIAAARTGCAIDPLPLQKSKNGKALPVFPRDERNQPYHPDPNANAILRQIIEEPLVQFEGRGRGVLREHQSDKRLLVIRCHTIDLPTPDHTTLDPKAYDVGPTWDQIAMGGIAYQSPVHASRAYFGTLYGLSEADAQDAATKRARDIIKREIADEAKANGKRLIHAAYMAECQNRTKTKACALIAEYEASRKQDQKQAGEAAKKAFQRWRVNAQTHVEKLAEIVTDAQFQSGTFPYNNISYGNVPHWISIKFRKEGARERPASAFIALGKMTLDEARERIMAALGPLALFEVDMPSPEPPPVRANVPLAEGTSPDRADILVKIGELLPEGESVKDEEREGLLNTSKRSIAMLESMGFPDTAYYSIMSATISAARNGGDFALLQTLIAKALVCDMQTPGGALAALAATMRGKA